MERIDRARLAYTALAMLDERRRQMWGADFGLTDSCVLDVIDAWTTGACTDYACSSDHCCDYQALSVLVWAAVEEAPAQQ